MLTWLKTTVAGSGLGRIGVIGVLGFAIVLATGVFGIALEFTGIAAFALSLSIGTLGFFFEVLAQRSRSRRRAIISVWPEVLDSLASASASGISVTESLIELAETGPAVLRAFFATLERDIEFGSSLTAALMKLKLSLGSIHSDRLIELIQIVSEAGGEGFNQALKIQAQLTREELALWGELESKQGWVSGTAKLAVAAPWLIVAMLSTRPENSNAYSSNEGSAILLIGLIVSIFAYRLIQLLGGISEAPRVFAK